MKALVNGLLLLVILVGLFGCNPDKDLLPAEEKKDTIAGEWTLGRIRFSGFPTPYEIENGDVDPAQYGIEERIRLHSDSTFVLTQRTGEITDFDGTWKFIGQDLKLQYRQGVQEQLTLNSNKNSAQLISTPYEEQDTLVNPTTKKPEVVKYQVQFVYERR